MKHKKWLAAGVAMLSALTLAACSNSNNSQGTTKHITLPANYNVNGRGTSAGNNSTLRMAEVNDSPFAGIPASTLQSNGEDGDVYAPGDLKGGTLFKTDNNSKIVDGGMANLKLDRATKTATITLRNNAKWSNGMKVTAKDVEYPYEIIAAPKTTSQQFSSDYNSIKGMAAFHTGKAKTISGITFPKGPKGNVVKIQYTNFPPSLQYAGNSFMWDDVEPYEYYKGTPIDKLASSPQVRKKPIFVGPYKLQKQVQGESTSWVPNPYYYGKKPHIKHINIQVISTSNFAASAKAKKYDLYSGGVGSQYQQVKNLKDYVITGSLAQELDYFGFVVGHANSKGVSVTDKNAKMANPNLRKALMYAINIDATSKKFGNGLSWRGTSLIPEYFKQYHDNSLAGYKYNPKKAEQLLDAAGYKKKGKWRVQPNGKPLTINFGTMQGSPVSAAINQYYLQQWHKIGLNVQYAGGKPMEMNSFYSTLEKPKQNKMDFYSAAFSLSSEPTPTQIFGSSASMNMAHFASKKNDQLLAQMNDKQAWNQSYRTAKFKEWQKFMNDQAVYVPNTDGTGWTPVNKRVVNYNSSNANDLDFWSDLQLSSADTK